MGVLYDRQLLRSTQTGVNSQYYGESLCAFIIERIRGESVEASSPVSFSLDFKFLLAVGHCLSYLSQCSCA
ncbi:hypothetical protein BEWA_029620 [Theileria equi strain WA]|uniref:Uncharacterized protein n=1 Tax=Theileria equi strain WA TaxID=1537102 RepID=L0AYL6_THEEQ|nr:hypothetical protein BEWA_029620 [Theileria equi strain WA]AFZ80111.1 hypothetical protein BEWA_029620 [Theileria equi strain WA]|eukprot:XP_004829777.1 hypothetical protein BEWA_029620 [Theileria equi strain WA]